MTIKKQEEFFKKGAKDASRHRKKVRDAIKNNIQDIVGEQSIISRKKGSIVKVPVKGLKSYRFKYSSGKGGGGYGHGPGEKGDVIGEKPKPGDQPGQPGQEAGIDYLETEMEIEELIEMMMEDLGLPNLLDKQVVETLIHKGWTTDSIEKTGIPPRLHRKRTVKAALLRNAAVIGELMRQSGKTEEECWAAWNLAKSDAKKALEILADPKADLSGEARVFIDNDALRYRTIKEDVEHTSNAVILAMMDVSGSMTTKKKYLARSFFFWMNEFLKHLYKNVEIRFIAHTTEAKVVDEHTFFYTGESGGTYCYTAYEKAAELIKTRYDVSRWNVYCFHWSDGEDFDTALSVKWAKKLLDLGVNMFGFGQIELDAYAWGKLLMQAYREEFSLTEYMKAGEMKVYTKEGLNFLGITIKDKKHIYPALQEFLHKERKF